MGLLPALDDSARIGRVGARAGSGDGSVRSGVTICKPYDFVTLVTPESPAAIREEIAAFSATALRTHFQSDTWLRAFGDAGEDGRMRPLEAVGSIEGRIAVVLPLVVKAARGLRVLTWQAASPSDYCAPLVAPGFAAAFEASDAAGLMRCVAQAIGGIDLIYLPKMPEGLGRWRNPLVTGASWRYYAGAHVIDIEGRLEPGERASPAAAWDAFYARTRSSRTRQSLRAKDRALRKLGTVAFTCTHDAARVGAIVEACLDMKGRQLERDGANNLYADPAYRQALVRAITQACPDGAWAASLDLDGRSVSAAFGMITGDDWIVYQIAMGDGPETRLSVGQLLIVELLRECVGRGAAQLDFGLGDEAYKLVWCDRHLDLRTTALPLTPVGHAAALALRLREAGRIRLSRHPATRRLARRIKPMLKRVGLSV